MHLFTGLQLVCLAVLWIVKSSTLALAFPFFVVGLVPFRMTLKYLFNPRELDAVSFIKQFCISFTISLQLQLDGVNAGQLVEDN